MHDYDRSGCQWSSATEIQLVQRCSCRNTPSELETKPRVPSAKSCPIFCVRILDSVSFHWRMRTRTITPGDPAILLPDPSAAAEDPMCRAQHCLLLGQKHGSMCCTSVRGILGSRDGNGRNHVLNSHSFPKGFFVDPRKGGEPCRRARCDFGNCHGDCPHQVKPS